MEVTLETAIDRKELKLVNSAVRGFCQKHYEFRAFRGYLKKNRIDLTNKVILDAGCGAGYSSEKIIEEFQPKELFAFDILPEEVELARRKCPSANLFVGDVTDIKLPSDKFDAVFIFEVLHHVTRWRVALREINRVLKSGAVFLVQEPHKKGLDNIERFFRIYHPKESRFEWPEFIEGLEDSGFRVVERRKIYLGSFQSCMCIKE
jgi:ubiquinone/menaquinone biosynthesis C-methylase UbiE